MPHSETPAVGPSSTTAATTQMEGEVATIRGEGSLEEEDDTVMVEAGEVQGLEVSKQTPEPPTAQTAKDEDMGVEIKQESKAEIKLEDLFAGIDSDDDDFSTSENHLNSEEHRYAVLLPGFRAFFANANSDSEMMALRIPQSSCYASTISVSSPGGTCFSG